MDQKNFVVSYQTFKSLSELSASDQELCLQAEEALKSSYSPYSNFKVGAALKLSNEEVVTGSNQENVAYPSGLCAERVALFTVGAAYPEATVKPWQLLQKAVTL